MQSLFSKVASTVKNALPVPLASRHQNNYFGGNKDVHDRANELSAMRQDSTIYSVVTRIATTQANVCWHLYKVADSRGRIAGPEQRREVFAHPALALLQKPNKFYTQSKFVKAAQQHKELTGEMWWVIARSPVSSMPIEMWPVRPDRMAPVADPDDFILGYEYTSPDGQVIPLDVDEVITQMDPDPENPYRGLGPVGRLLLMTETVKFSQVYNRNFFINGARPGGVVKTGRDNVMTRTEWEEQQYRWQSAHGGVAGAHKVGFIEGKDADYIPDTYTQADMQFVELRLAGRDVVYEAWGVSSSVMGVSENANRAISEAHKAQFAEQITDPRAGEWKDTLNSLLELFGDLGKGYTFDYDSPVPADQTLENSTLTAQTTAYSTMILAGADADEVATLVGFDGLKHTGVIPRAAPAPKPTAEPVADLPDGTDPNAAEAADNTIAWPLLQPINWDEIMEGSN